MEATISVIIPVYKTEQYLNRCVQSVLRQTYQNLEIILVDDGSPDGSGQLCDRLAQEDSRIRVIHKENGGASSARNAGLDISTGEFVCFVDSDDYVEKDYVSTLFRLIYDYGTDLAKIDYAEVSIDDYSAPYEHVDARYYQGSAVEKAYLELKVDSACVFMYKRVLIGESRFLEGTTSEDILFNFEIFQKAKTFVYAPVKKYFYYYNPGSVSNGPLNRNMMNYLLFREEIYAFYQKQNNEELCNKAEVLYARAAMGLMARMALYGIAPGLDEKAYRHIFCEAFKPHSRAFYKDPDVPFSRKLLAVLAFRFYPVIKCLRGVIK